MENKVLKNEVCSFNNFEVIIRNPSEETKKSHIQVIKRSMTLKTLDVFLRNLANS